MLIPLNQPCQQKGSVFMQSLPQPQAITLEEYEALPEDMRVEVLTGRFMVCPARQKSTRPFPPN